MSAADTLERGREALQQQAWADAYALLSAAQRNAPLEPEDLERLALAATWPARTTIARPPGWAPHQGFARRGDVRRAARCAFWQACGLLFRGELAPAMGWIARGRRVLEAAPQDCAERGWLLLLTALPVMFEGDRAPRTWPLSRQTRSPSDAATSISPCSPGSAGAGR